MTWPLLVWRAEALLRPPIRNIAPNMKSLEQVNRELLVLRAGKPAHLGGLKLKFYLQQTAPRTTKMCLPAKKARQPSKQPLIARFVVAKACGRAPASFVASTTGYGGEP